MTEYKVDSKVWFRESTQEWILEVSGEIKGTSFTSRHTQPWHVPPEDVASLGSTYERIAELEEALKNVAQTLAWIGHGECRGYSENLLSTNDAIALAKDALKPQSFYTKYPHNQFKHTALYEASDK